MYVGFCVPFFFIVLNSCGKTSLDQALNSAGENKSEMERVLEYYKDDSLKLAAAHFLIENMDCHYYYDGAAIDFYYKYMDSIFSNCRGNRDFWKNEYNKLLNTYGKEIAKCETEKYYDIKELDADFLITQIEEAFKYWNQNWNKQYSFKFFCRYVLPYRVGNEKVSFWRHKYGMTQKDFSLYRIESEDNSTYCYGIVDDVVSKDRQFLYYPQQFLPDFPLSLIGKLQAGSCREYAAKCVAMLRARGIAATIDFVPQWGNRSMGHDWCVFFPNEKTAIPLNSGDRIGLQFMWHHHDRMPKVFRKTYEKQPQSLFERNKGKEDIPILFDTPYIMDVTDQYTQTSDVRVDFCRKYTSNIVYLAVFDNNSWCIVDWTFRKGRHALFHRLGRNIIYLPVGYMNGDIIPIGHPFLLDGNGKVHKKMPDFSRKQLLKAKRKYRIGQTKNWAEAVIGGVFQVSRTPDFTEGTATIAIIDTLTDNHFYTLYPFYKGTHRYFRYLAPDGSYGQMAELTVFDEKGDTIFPDKLIGDFHVKSGCKPDNLFDGDPLTYYDTFERKNVWIGMEQDVPFHISKISFLPRNDDNFIKKGDLYELFYWYAYGWKSHGKMVGGDVFELVFDDVPQGALYLLRDHTSGKEERIFTYEDGKQIWW